MVGVLASAEKSCRLASGAHFVDPLRGSDRPSAQLPYPEKYTRQYGFQNYQEANPTRPLPGDKVDADLNVVERSIDEIVDFLMGISRSDGALANASVGLDQLSPGVLAALGLEDIEALIEEAVGDLSLTAASVTVTPVGNITSTTVQTALAEIEVDYIATVAAEAVLRTAADALKANITSPTFLGVPAAPTPSFGDDSTQIATTAFVQAAVDAGTGAFFATPEAYGAVGDGVADDTVALQAAIDAGVWVKGDPSKTYRISESLIRTTSFFRFEDIHLYGTAANFNNTTLAGRLGTNAVFLYVHGELGGGFAAIGNVVINNCRFESEVSHGRRLNAVVVRNVVNAKVSGNKIWKFPVAMGIKVDSCPRVRIFENFIHDFNDDSDTLTGGVQCSGIEVDQDRVNSVPSSAVNITNNFIQNLLFGPIAKAAYGQQTDGINLASLDPEKFVIGFNQIDNVGDGIDVFGQYGTIVGNVLTNIDFTAIKLPHGPRHITVDANSIDTVGNSGIWVLPAATRNAERIIISDNKISNINPGGLSAFSSAGIYFDDGSPGGFTIENCLVSGNIIDAGATGEPNYLIAIATVGLGNVFDDNKFVGTGTSGQISPGPVGTVYKPLPWVITLNDDTAASFNLGGRAALVEVTSLTEASECGIAYIRAGGGALGQAFVSGGNFEVTTGILAAAGGTDGKVTVSGHTDGNFYISNRRNGQRTFVISMQAVG